MEYEEFFLSCELEKFFPSSIIKKKGNTIVLSNVAINELVHLRNLTYIESFCVDNRWENTLQGDLESEHSGNNKRQKTRYSTHGLHEYKGKFNPQIVRAIMNYLNVSNSNVVFDPFNGSGTTILECAHSNIEAYGIDINPLACYIANTKIEALSIDVELAGKMLSTIKEGITGSQSLVLNDDERTIYLKKWIPEDTLKKLEYIRNSLKKCEKKIADLFLISASDLIRDYSFQEPKDLRIRRRITPFPEEPFEDAYYNYIEKQIVRIINVQAKIKNVCLKNRAFNSNIVDVPSLDNKKIDVAITSPPYATALPYIDTQRISLVWLDLCAPSNIMQLEASLIGSRELLKSEKTIWLERLICNKNNLCGEVYDFVISLNNAVSSRDGFRRQAVPMLMYRYFAEMQKMFLNVKRMIKKDGKYALVVGHNKTVLGGTTFQIDTPLLLSKVAESCGWEVQEILPLQTYKRYGLNQKNAINHESLIILINHKEVI